LEPAAASVTLGRVLGAGQAALRAVELGYDRDDAPPETSQWAVCFVRHTGVHFFLLGVRLFFSPVTIWSIGKPVCITAEEDLIFLRSGVFGASSWA
jgi:hypothetical protein